MLSWFDVPALHATCRPAIAQNVSVFRQTQPIATASSPHRHARQNHPTSDQSAAMHFQQTVSWLRFPDSGYRLVANVQRDVQCRSIHATVLPMAAHSDACQPQTNLTFLVRKTAPQLLRRQQSDSTNFLLETAVLWQTPMLAHQFDRNVFSRNRPALRPQVDKRSESAERRQKGARHAQ